MKYVLEKKKTQIRVRLVSQIRVWMDCTRPSDYSSQLCWLKSKDFIYYWKADGRFIMERFNEATG